MTDRVLVAYESKHGSTAEIAERIATRLRDAGVEVDLVRASDVKSLEPYRAVVLGSAVYMGRWRGPALRLLRRRARELAARDVWLFSSGPVGEPPAPDDAKAERFLRPRKVERLAEVVHAHEHAVLGGAVAEDGGFMRRNMAKGIPPELRDRRDWDEIDAWARGIATKLGAAPQAPT